MAKLTKLNIGLTEVERVAKLARLELPKKSLDSFTRSFVSTLEWISKLQEVDIADVEETSQVTGQTNVTRPDKIKPSLDRDTFLQNAPASEANQLKVRAIFSK